MATQRSMPDTIESVDPMVAEILRRKTTWERVQMALDANRTVRKLIETHIRNLHPDWRDAQVNAEVARRMLNGTD